MTQRKKERKTWLLPAVLLSAALLVMLLLYAPLVIYAGNLEDFTFDIVDVLKACLPMLGIAAAAAAAVFLLAGLVGETAVLILLGAAAAAFPALLLHGSFLTAGLPLLDGTPVDWSEFSRQKLLSAVIWVVCAAAVTVITVKLGKKALKKLAALEGGFGLLFLGVSLALTLLTTPGVFAPGSDTCMTAEGFLELSDRENLVILMLDSVDAGHFERIAEEDPQVREMFEDFTFYRNTLSGYPFTQYAVPFFLFGQWYEGGESYSEYLCRSVAESELMSALSERGYRSGMYFDYLQQERLSSELFQNFEPVREFRSPGLFRRMLLKLTAYRYLPYGLKQFGMLLPENIAADSLKSSEGNAPDYYEIGIREIYDRICRTELTRSADPCFRMICTEGAHAPFIYDKDLRETENGSYDDSIRASLTMADAYLRKMKDGDVYDNSVIIVLADHGLREENPNAGTGRQNPILLIKGRNEHHPYQVSDAPISHEDLPDAYLRLLDGESGAECFPWKEGDVRTRRHLLSVVRENKSYELVTEGHASDLGALCETGNVFG